MFGVGSGAVCAWGFLMVTIRVRSLVWFATGAVMALVVSLMVMQAWRVEAAPGDSDTTFVSMSSCRLAAVSYTHPTLQTQRSR